MKNKTAGAGRALEQLAHRQSQSATNLLDDQSRAAYPLSAALADSRKFKHWWYTAHQGSTTYNSRELQLAGAILGTSEQYPDWQRDAGNKAPLLWAQTNPQAYLQATTEGIRENIDARRLALRALSYTHAEHAASWMEKNEQSALIADTRLTLAHLHRMRGKDKADETLVRWGREAINETTNTLITLNAAVSAQAIQWHHEKGTLTLQTLEAIETLEAGDAWKLAHRIVEQDPLLALEILPHQSYDLLRAQASAHIDALKTPIASNWSSAEAYESAGKLLGIWEQTQRTTRHIEP